MNFDAVPHNTWVFIAFSAGAIALSVWMMWPATVHRCRYLRCPHKKEKE